MPPTEKKIFRTVGAGYHHKLKESLDKYQTQQVYADVGGSLVSSLCRCGRVLGVAVHLGRTRSRKSIIQARSLLCTICFYSRFNKIVDGHHV